MSRKLKILSLILILAASIIIAFQTVSNAEIINGKGKFGSPNTIKHTLNNLTDFYGLEYQNVYCIEAGQGLNFSKTFAYGKKHKFEFNGTKILKTTYYKLDKHDGSYERVYFNPENVKEYNDEQYIKFAKGLAYIFSLEEDVKREKYEWYRGAANNDPLQLALHAYIKKCGTMREPTSYDYI